jgi:ATP-binding cassette subfamily B protein
VVQAFRFVWRAGPGEFSLIIGLEVVAAAAVAAQLLLARDLFDALLGGGRHRVALDVVAPQLVSLAVATVVAAFASTALAERRAVLTELVDRHVHSRLIDVASRAALSAFDEPGFYDRLERAKTHAAEHTYQLASGVVATGSGITGLAALIAVLVTLGLPFLPLVLLAYVPLWYASSRNGRAAYEFTFWATTADRQRKYLQSALTSKAEAKEIRLFGLSEPFRDRYDRIYDRRISEFRRVVARRLRRSLLATVVSTAVIMGAAALLIQLAADGDISTADAAVAVVAIVQLGSRLRTVNSGAVSLTEASLFLSEFVDLLGSQASDRPRERPPSSAFTGVSAQDLSFAYPETGHMALRGVTVTVRPGEMVALVGRNGSGKSTLAKLLCGLYAPTSGRIVWGGGDVAGAGSDGDRPSIAAVFQDYVCYQLAARDNVGVGDVERTTDLQAIRSAANDAGIDDVLAGLPSAYETVLSRAFEGGAELSIGQWQRVALARAFFRDAPFVILDEPAAALDAEAEHDLFAHVRRLHHDKAALVISHRMSTVRDADRIYVLDEGSVVESGTHDELLRAEGLYAELFNLQASAYRSAEPADT